MKRHVTKPCDCKTKDGAHYGWCSSVGGPGYHPGSLEAVIVRARARAAAPPASPAPTPRRRDTNNGWWSTPPSRLAGSPETPQPSQPACPPSVSRESTQSRKSTSWNGDKPRGLDKDLLKLISPVVREQGWRYEHGHHGKKNRLWHPDGKRFVVIAHTGEDSYFAIHRTKSQLKRMGAKL